MISTEKRRKWYCLKTRLVHVRQTSGKRLLRVKSGNVELVESTGLMRNLELLSKSQGRDKMKTLAMVLVLLFLAVTSHAALVDNGNGLVYDTDLNITWTQSTTTLTNWYVANTWATTLTRGGVSGWTLPSSLNFDGSGPIDNYNVTTSQMGHLFYTELGNIGVISPTGGPNWPTGWGITHKGLFPTLQWSIYWSSTEWGVSFPGEWDFNFAYGSQAMGSKDGKAYALAVHEGNITDFPVETPKMDIPKMDVLDTPSDKFIPLDIVVVNPSVPLPPSMLLLAGGLIVIGIRKYKR